MRRYSKFKIKLEESKMFIYLNSGKFKEASEITPNKSINFMKPFLSGVTSKCPSLLANSKKASTLLMLL